MSRDSGFRSREENRLPELPQTARIVVSSLLYLPTDRYFFSGKFGSTSMDFDVSTLQRKTLAGKSRLMNTTMTMFQSRGNRAARISADKSRDEEMQHDQRDDGFQQSANARAALGATSVAFDGTSLSILLLTVKSHAGKTALTKWVTPPSGQLSKPSPPLVDGLPAKGYLGWTMMQLLHLPCFSPCLLLLNHFLFKFLLFRAQLTIARNNGAA